jgi:sugar phosphate isomerase/epimerase
MESTRENMALLISSDHLAERKSWPDMLRRAKSLGFAGIELFGKELVDGCLTHTLVMGDLRELARELDVIMTAHPWFDWAEIPEAEAAARGLELLQRCSDMGIQLVNIHLNFLATPHGGWVRAARIVRPWLEKLEANGQTLYFENVPDYLPNPFGSTPKEFREFFSLLDEHPRVKLNVDVGHAHICGNLRAFATELGAFWDYTHLADNLGDTDSHLGPGMGSVDWDEFALLAKAASYKGIFVCEFSENHLAESEPVLNRAFSTQGWMLPHLSYDTTAR